MPKRIHHFHFLFLILLVFASSANAQNGSVPPSDGSAGLATSSDAGALPRAQEPIQAVTSSQSEAMPVSPQPTPPAGTAPVETPTTPTPIGETPVASENVAVSEISGFLPIAIGGIVSLAVLLAATFGIQSLRKNKKKEGEDGSRCFDIKKLMEKKFQELTDLKGQLKSAAQEKARGVVREGAQGTTAGDFLAVIERAEKEYNRLKLLYEKCMIEVGSKKRVFLIHGWDGAPEHGWFPWLKSELEKRGFAVFVPELPDAGAPRIEKWIPKIAEVAGAADADTYFVGHSMGCQAIVRYLETLPNDTKIGGAVFVGGFFKRLTEIDSPEEQKIADAWLLAPLDFPKVRAHLKESVAIFSDDDPWVPLDNQDDFRLKLNSRILIEHAKGHFTGDRDGMKELPIVLEQLLLLMNR